MLNVVSGIKEGTAGPRPYLHVLTPPCSDGLVSCPLLSHLRPGRPCASSSAQCWARPAHLREGGAVGHMVQSDYDVLIKRPASEEGGSEGERWTIG